MRGLTLFLLAATCSRCVHGQWDPNQVFFGSAGSSSSTGAGLPRYIDWSQNFLFDRNIRFQQIDRTTQQRNVRGISIPGHYDTTTFVNMYLGIPYAKPPIGALRFEVPQNLDNERYEGILQAWYYRPSCPQPLAMLQQQIANFSYTNEDCLYLNIFEPNITSGLFQGQKYPVIVFFHGGMFTQGSAIQYPGIVLAQRDYIVVTVQYRLGPLGFLTTSDSSARGNFGLYDQLEALRWIRKNIGYFNGLPDQITIMGHEAGAAAVGIHLISPQMRRPGEPLFNRAIMMSGSDLSSWAVIPKEKYPVEYARALARTVNCPYQNSANMIACLRQKNAQDLVLAALTVPLRPGETAGPFVPTVDANQVDGYASFLPDNPALMRQNLANIQDVPVLAGFTKDDGSLLVAKNFSGWFSDINNQVTKDEFNLIVANVTARRNARDRSQVQNAITFQYTYWSNPDNGTARRQMLLDIFTDEFYAAGVDGMLKSQAQVSETRNPGSSSYKVWMYKWDYRTENSDSNTWWLGAYNGMELQYVFGWPYLNKTYQNITGIQLQTQYGELDRNVSNATMQMWKNFARVGNPIPSLDNVHIFNFINKSWYPFKTNNLTYFQLNYNSTNERDYSQSKLAFWNYYIYDILYLDIYTTTPIYPTHWPYQDYQIATFTLSGVFFILLVIFIPLLCMACRQKRSRSKRGYY